MIATKAVSQTFSHLVKIVYFGILLSSAQGSVEWWFALLMVGLAVVGTTLSRKVLEAMSDKDFRVWSRRVVTVIGVFYLANGLWALAGQ